MPDITPISICIDCYTSLANGCETHDTDTCTCLNLIDDSVEVTVGGCTDCDRCECCDYPACECAHYGSGHGFSWRACEGCGSPLGGARYTASVWSA